MRRRRLTVAEQEVLITAIEAMIVKFANGAPGYRTHVGVPQVMPPAVEAQAYRAAHLLDALRRERTWGD